MAELWQNVRNVASCGVSVVEQWLGRGIELNPPVEENGTWGNCVTNCMKKMLGWGECINEMFFVLLYFIYISEVFCKKHGMPRFQGQGKQT